MKMDVSMVSLSSDQFLRYGQITSCVILFFGTLFYFLRPRLSRPIILTASDNHIAKPSPVVANATEQSDVVVEKPDGNVNIGTEKPAVVAAESPEVIIVGSGILGSALAAALGADGRRVAVIERDMKKPDRIVGELLQPGGIRALRTLGLAHCVDGIDGHIIRGYLIHEGNRSVHISYPTDCDSGRAFHHGRFVMALRAAAQRHPNVRYVEGTVSRLVEVDGVVKGVEYRQKNSEETCKLFAALTVVADGCFSRLRKSLVSVAPQTKSHFIGLLMRDCPQAMVNHAELVLTDTSPVLVYRLSEHCTRVLVDVRGGLPSDIKRYLVDQVMPALPSHLRDPFLDAVCNSPVRAMPNSFLPPAPLLRRGVACLGDALNMRHPLTGGGMSVALNDVVIYRQLLRAVSNLRDVDAVARATRELYWRRKAAHSFVVDVLSMALYELFAANDRHLRALKAACFEYFELGGECVTGPVALLSVLRPRPLLLVGHFFAVAAYAVYVTVRGGGGVWGLHRTLGRAVGVLGRACAVIFPLIWCEVKSYRN